MRIFILVFLILLSACSHKADITKQAVDYNKSVEDAQNQMLLLNIIRASKKRPMYFTQIGLMRGQWSQSSSASTSIPIGPDAANSYPLGLGAARSSTPSFDMNVLSGKEFMTGILSPVDPNILMRYWEQDANKEVLLYLLVRRLELGERCVIGNPWIEIAEYQQDQRCEKGLHRQLQSYVFNDGLELVWQKDKKPFGPRLSDDDLKDTSKLVELDESPLYLHRKKDGYQVLKKTKGLAFRLHQNGKERFITKAPADSHALGSYTLRSPQGIIYYLGELMRYDLLDKDDPHYVPSPKVCFAECEEKDRPLFRVIKSDSKMADAAVSVEYEGEWYNIPSGDEGSYATYSLAFIAELLALQSSADALPRTGAVTVIGP